MLYRHRWGLLALWVGKVILPSIVGHYCMYVCTRVQGGQCGCSHGILLTVPIICSFAQLLADEPKYRCRLQSRQSLDLSCDPRTFSFHSPYQPYPTPFSLCPAMSDIAKMHTERAEGDASKLEEESRFVLRAYLSLPRGARMVTRLMIRKSESTMATIFTTKTSQRLLRTA